MDLWFKLHSFISAFMLFLYRFLLSFRLHSLESYYTYLSLALLNHTNGPTYPSKISHQNICEHSFIRLFFFHMEKEKPIVCIPFTIKSFVFEITFRNCWCFLMALECKIFLAVPFIKCIDCFCFLCSFSFLLYYNHTVI